MKAFRYKDTIVYVEFSPNCITIQDSYKVRSSRIIKGLLTEILADADCPEPVRRRGLTCVVREWQAHNLCYLLNFQRDHTATVDLDLKQSFDSIYHLTGFLYGLIFW